MTQVLTDPSLRQHPTVQRIQRELGAELFVAMDKAGRSEGRSGGVSVFVLFPGGKVGFRLSFFV